MAIDFPNSPTIGDTYTTNGKTYRWDGTVWGVYGTFTVDSTASDTEPTGVGNGHIWYRSDQSQTLIRYNGTWVEVGSAGGFDSSSTNFPTSIDSGTGFAAVEALQAKVGVDSSAVTSSHDYKLTNGIIPVGTTAERPASPTDGMIRYNSELKQVESYIDGSWNTVARGFVANGGTVTTLGGYKYHTFTTSGTFSVVSGSGDVDYLIVGGGGGGGAGETGNGYGGGGGGGGAGGLLYGSYTITTAANYPVTVGAGGSKGTGGNSGTDGGDSSVFSLTALGGGRGSGEGSNSPGSGGSGGGIGGDSGGSPGSGTTGQGSDGGARDNRTGGGGGGRSEAGNTDGKAEGGDGYTWLNGSTYAGGGGGGGGAIYTVNAPGGDGGGGQGGATDGTSASNQGWGGEANGQVNTGGGGGGAAAGRSDDSRGAGGSGIVIIRYLT